MPAYMKLGDIPGEATDQNHQDWIKLESIGEQITRSISEGSTDQLRVRGETTLCDLQVVRHMDKSSPKLAEACANGTFFKEVTIDLCSTLKNKQQTYLRITLQNAIVTGYGFHATANAEPAPSEDVSLGFTDIVWEYTELDPTSGDSRGQVCGQYTPAVGCS